MTHSTQQFQSWLAAAYLIDRPALYVALPGSIQHLSEWTATLAPAELERLIEKVQRFLTDAQLDLAWLLDGKLDQSPDLKKPMEEVIALFVLAYERAECLTEPAREFAAFQHEESL